ncbi:MAG: hypothetical protein QM831_22765 [Kofleriaceae bacterium]
MTDDLTKFSLATVDVGIEIARVTFGRLLPSVEAMGLVTSVTQTLSERVRVMDEGELEQLVERTVGGEVAAWRVLWAEVEPWLEKIVASPRFLGRVGQRDDDRSNILVEVMARLHADGFHRLRLYIETRRATPTLKFKPWLRVVTKRVGIDYLRGHENYRDQRSNPQWIEPGTLPPESQLSGVRPPVTNQNTALELLRYATGAVPEPLLSALELWTSGASYDDIARELEISVGESQKHVRAALERLRRRFRNE